MKTRAALLLACALAGTAANVTCVFPEVGLGAPCESQSECLSGDACVRVDPEDTDEGNVCLPMLDLAAPQACTVDEDCPAAGFPVDASCNGDGLCTCDPDDGFTCDFEEVLGEHTCRCLVGGIDVGESCEDDAQCITTHCGNGACVAGLTGDACDNDDDCQFGEVALCTEGTCE
jgi:hypothetical protein